MDETIMQYKLHENRQTEHRSEAAPRHSRVGRVYNEAEIWASVGTFHRVFEVLKGVI